MNWDNLFTIDYFWVYYLVEKMNCGDIRKQIKKKKKPTLKSCCCLDKFNFKIDKKKKPTLINVTVVCLDKSNFFVLLLCNRILKS